MTAVRKKEVKIISFSIKIIFKVFSEKTEFEKSPLFYSMKSAEDTITQLVRVILQDYFLTFSL